MADTSNLSKFLGDVAEAIRAKRESTSKIPAEQFDSEILKIETGVDTTDATATSNDIISPKTAYVNGQKLTGAIEATYKDVYAQGFTSSETVDTNLKYVGENYFVKMTSAMIYVLQLEGAVLNLVASYALSNLSSYNSTSYTRGDCSIYSIENNDIRFIIPAANGKGTIYYLRFDANTNTISLVTSATPCSPMYSTAVHAKFPNHTSDYFMFWSEQCNYGGIDKQIVLSYTINSTSMSMKTVLFNSKFYGNTASNVHFAHNDNLFCLTRTTAVDNQSSIKQYQYVLDDTFNVLSTNYSTYDYRNMVISDKGNYGYLGGNIYSVSYTSANVPVIGDIVATTTETIQGLFALDYVKTTTSIVNKIYKINENGTLEEKISTGNSLITNRDYRGIIQVVSGEEGLLVENLTSLGEKVITKMIRDTISYYDSADADVLTNDIVSGKIAYNASGKVIGTLPEYEAYVSADTANSEYDNFVNLDTDENGNQKMFYLERYVNEDKVLRQNSRIDAMIRFEDIVEKGGISADQIVKGNTVLGIEGTAESGSGAVKLFKTEEEMQADTDPKEGDLAIVYREEIQNATSDSIFSVAKFPTTVVLPEAMTGYADIMYRAVDDSVMFDCWGSLNVNNFSMNCYLESGSIRIIYESTDGITYTRTDGGEEIIDFGTEIYCAYPDNWNDAIGYFIQAGGNTFDGLFEHKTNVLNAMGAFSISVVNNEITDTTLTDVSIPMSTLEAISQQIKTSRNLASVAFTVLLDANKTDLIIIACTYTSDPYTANCPYIIYNDAQYLPTDNKVYKEVVHYKYNLETDVLSEYEPIIENEVTLQHYNSDTHIIKGIPFDGYIVCDMFDGVPKDMTAYTWSGGTTYAEYTSKTITCDYQYTGKYFIAPTQLTLKDINELLPGKIAYGKNGVVVGDGSISTRIPSVIKNLFGNNEMLNIKYLTIDPYVNETEKYTLCKLEEADVALALTQPGEFSSSPAIFYQNGTNKNYYFDGEYYYIAKQGTIGVLTLYQLDKQFHLLHTYTINIPNVPSGTTRKGTAITKYNDTWYLLFVNGGSTTSFSYGYGTFDLETSSYTSILSGTKDMQSTSYTSLITPWLTAYGNKIGFGVVQVYKTSSSGKYNYKGYVAFIDLDSGEMTTVLDVTTLASNQSTSYTEHIVTAMNDKYLAFHITYFNADSVNAAYNLSYNFDTLQSTKSTTVSGNDDLIRSHLKWIEYLGEEYAWAFNSTYAARLRLSTGEADILTLDKSPVYMDETSSYGITPGAIYNFEGDQYTIEENPLIEDVSSGFFTKLVRTDDYIANLGIKSSKIYWYAKLEETNSYDILVTNSTTTTCVPVTPYFTAPAYKSKLDAIYLGEAYEGTISPAEYNTALDTVNEILGNEEE